MATPSVKRNSIPPTPLPSAPNGQLEVVDPRWLLRALGLTIAGAAVLSYLALCLLIYQGSWQLFLQPSSRVDAKPAERFEAVQFDAAATGKPRLTGWWIASDSTPARTVLFLHDGSGSLGTAAKKLDLLHQAGVNVFAIDYRGYGQSDGPRPTESRMAEDAEAALTYLVETRHLAMGQIVPYGEGLGAVFALRLLNSHSEVRAAIVDDSDPQVFAAATAGNKSWLLPMRLLVRERFDIRTALQQSHKPKLLLSGTPFHDGPTPTGQKEMAAMATEPKMSVTFQGLDSTSAYLSSLHRFLDEYVP
jgi:pimeloyl-ACP methyl ester carboxylesterase